MAEFRVTPSQAVEFTRIVRDLFEATTTDCWTYDLTNTEFLQSCRALDELDSSIGWICHYDVVKYEVVHRASTCLFIIAGKLADFRVFELLTELNTLLVKIVKN